MDPNSGLRQRKSTQSNQKGSTDKSSKISERPRRKPNKKSKQSTGVTPSATYYISAWVFARLLGLLYMIAFISAWVQIHGLIGSNGVSPLSDYFARLTSSVSLNASFLNFPTIFWLDQSDWMIHGVCALGTLSGFGLFLDILPAITSFLCWFLFLSTCIAGQNFYLFQWDLLLLETGFLMMFFHSFHWSIKPLSQNPRDFHPPDSIFWLYRLLLFRLHFARGLQELFGPDRTWRTLSAFNFHFQNQQSPTWLAWYFHQFPNLVQQGLVFWVLTVEIGVIFLIFGPQLFRRTACLYVILLQLFYIFTGNFGTFYWNVMLLCILLLDDAMFPTLIQKLTRVRRAKIKQQGRRKTRSSQPRFWHSRVAMFVAVAVIIFSAIPLSSLVQSNLNTPKPLMDAYKKVYPWRIVNLYTPLNRVQKDRFELLIQASLEAQNWQDYHFLYKPGSILDTRPMFLSPHISRLEYLLWVAAQTDYQQEIWISRLLHRILEDSPAAISLFQKEPFAEVPEYIRAARYKFEFTKWDQPTSDWWSMEFFDIYTPSFSQTIHSMSSRRKNLRARKGHFASL